MPRQEQIRITTPKVVNRITANTEERVYTVTYLDDPPERQETVHYFRTQGNYKRLFSPSGIPQTVQRMPFEEAQAYLDTHPMQEQWRGLNLLDVKNQATDDDLARLRHIPEIEILKIRSNKITDDGIRHICQLARLETLFIYSNNISDACLEHIACIKTLKLLVVAGGFASDVGRILKARQEACHTWRILIRQPTRFRQSGGFLTGFSPGF